MALLVAHFQPGLTWLGSLGLARPGHDLPTRPVRSPVSEAVDDLMSVVIDQLL
ncbi:hypothetical protein [Thermogemmatispora carboxidivorans]|uniref:hypothetical protein n=1 Tax=Thermogemmatispora carboxidivorans TaxID=1382306 RepID=UPI0012DBE8A6|nr:hypothetical protein [Thermogemmatispora carboxidivorans]